MTGKLGELIVPAIVLTGCLLFWWHIQEARSVAQRVPNLVMIFTIGATAIVLARRLIGRNTAEGPQEDGPDGSGGDLFLRRSAFIGLCVAYYLLFSRIGFDLANALFLLCAYRLAGLRWSLTAIATAVSVLSFKLLAFIMDFNVPSGPFGF